MGGILITVLAAILSFCSGSVLHKKMTVLQDPNETTRKVVVVTWKDEQDDGFLCHMFTDQKFIQKVLTSYESAYPVRRPTNEEMQDILAECNFLSLRSRRRQEQEEEKKSNWNIIFPGTKWCGPGNIAKNDDDLGTAADTDRCCRAHDKCDDKILSGETRHNLTNRSKFTKLSCKCDKELYDCLTRVNSVTSNTIGNTYFNILRSRCFKKDYPRGKECIKNASILKLTCLEYERDTNSPQVYQWFPAKIYKQLPVPDLLDPKLRLSDEKTEQSKKIIY